MNRRVVDCVHLSIADSSSSCPAANVIQFAAVAVEVGYIEPIAARKRVMGL